MGRKKNHSAKRNGSSKKTRVSQFKRQFEDFKSHKVTQQEAGQLNKAQQFRKSEGTYELIESPKKFIETIEALTRLLLVVVIVILVLVELGVELFELIHAGKWSLPPFDHQLISWFGMVVHYCFTRGR